MVHYRKICMFLLLFLPEHFLDLGIHSSIKVDLGLGHQDWQIQFQCFVKSPNRLFGQLLVVCLTNFLKFPFSLFLNKKP